MKASARIRVDFATRMGTFGSEERKRPASLPPWERRGVRRGGLSARRAALPFSRQTTIGGRCGCGTAAVCRVRLRREAARVPRFNIVSSPWPSKNRFAKKIANRRRERRVELPAMTAPGGAAFCTLLCILFYLDGKAEIQLFLFPYQGSICLKSG